jgi:hypothetical protein
MTMAGKIEQQPIFRTESALRNEILYRIFHQRR